MPRFDPCQVSGGKAPLGNMGGPERYVIFNNMPLVFALKLDNLKVSPRVWRDVLFGVR